MPTHVRKFAGQHWTPAQLQSRLSNWLQSYKVQVSGGRGATAAARRQQRPTGWQLCSWRRVCIGSHPTAALTCARRLAASSPPPAQRGTLPSTRRRRVPPAPPTRTPTFPPPWQHIDTGSSKPLVDLVSYGFVLSYALSWPRE